MSEEFSIINTIWAFVLVLYYFAGRKCGYADGYIDGLKKGHENALDSLDASSTFLQEQKP